MTLEDVYDKSDLYAIGRLMYDCLLPGIPFPTSTPSRPNPPDAEVRAYSFGGH